MNETVMVTGSHGYIGSNLCRILVEEGYNIIQIDKKIGSDILDINLFDYKPDYIVHLAAIASIGDCEIDKEQTIRDNILTCQMISVFADYMNIPVFFASSQAVKNPSSSTYAMTKFIGEQMFNQFNDCVIMRFANVFGGINFIDDKTSVVAKFCRAYRDKKPLIVNGSGSQTRDFIHVNDICHTIIQCMKRKEINVTFDLGTGIEISILGLAQMFGTSIQFDYESDMVGVQSNVADLDSIDRLLLSIPSMLVKDYIKEVATG